jgi:hypothetical protein
MCFCRSEASAILGTYVTSSSLFFDFSLENKLYRESLGLESFSIQLLLPKKQQNLLEVTLCPCIKPHCFSNFSRTLLNDTKKTEAIINLKVGRVNIARLFIFSALQAFRLYGCYDHRIKNIIYSTASA